MKISWKKFLIMSLCAFLLLSSVACGNPSNQGTASSTAPAVAGTQAASTAPNTTEDLYPKTLKIFSSFSELISKTGATDNNACEAWKEISRRTGTQITWIHPASGQKDALNLLIASGDLPDLIGGWDWQNVPGGAGQFGNDGVIIRLNDLMGKWMPNYSKNLDKTGERYAIEFNNGDIFYLPSLQIEQSMLTVTGPIVRQEWLDKVKMDYPKTVDDLYKMLVAFRDGDMNGDGKPVIPMTGYQFRGTGSNFNIGYLLWPFGTTYDFYQVDGKVLYGPMTPEFTEGMTYIAKLFAEGLIDKDWSSQGRTEVDAKFMNGQAGFEFGIQPSKMNFNMEGKDFNAPGFAYLRKDASSPAYAMDARYISYIQPTNSVAITSANKEPEKTARWIDYIFSDEGSLITNFGIEGTDYTMVNGVPTYTDAFKATMANDFALRIFGTQSTFPSLRVWAGFAPTLHPNAAKGMEAWAGSADQSRILPKLQLSGPQMDEVNTILTDILTYMDEQYVKLVNGQSPISSIPEVQAKLTSMGIDKVIKVYQDVYDKLKK